MANFHLRDKSLSLKAVGLLSKMLSFNDGWKFSTKGLSAICKEGPDAILSALRELEKHGYLVRHRQRDGKGRMSSTIFEIYEEPQESTPEREMPHTENPCVEKPDVDNPRGDKSAQINTDEVNALFEAAKGSKLELPILFGAFYGLRRSEAIGLKWDAIDFDQNTITIRHTVTSCDLDGKRVLVASDTTKTKSSMRTLPLVPFMRERLLTLKEEQQENRRLCGRSYIKEYLEYVCVNEIGDLIKPHYVTESFPKLLKAKGMRQIRYHDLRHSCASLLLANGVPMKQIQEWLGHSDFSTTANIYAHLDYSSKLTSADAMLNGLGFAQN